jgi:acyl-CoA oxidase
MPGLFSASSANPLTEKVIARELRGRTLSSFEKRLVDVLHDDMFRRTEDMRSSETCELSYRRLRYLNKCLDLRIADLFSDLDKLLALHEWAAVVDGTLTTLISIHYNLCIGSILQHGRGRTELEPFLEELETMDSIGVFLATELAYGNNLQALETEAVYDPGAREFVLHTPSARAQKFMPNTGAAGVAKLAVVMARLKVAGRDRGVFPFVVRIRTEDAVCPGVRVTALGDKPDFALDNAITSFDRVRIPKHHWLGGVESAIDDDGVFSSSLSPRRRFLQSLDRVQTGKLCLTVAALSMLRGSLQLALGYAQQRQTFAPGRSSVPILEYRTYQRAMFEGVAACYACAFLVQHVAARYRDRTAGDETEVTRLLAIGKVFVSSRATSIMAMCRERVGAQGLFAANRIISYWVGTNGIVTAEGDNELLLAKTARELVAGLAYEPPAEQAPGPPMLESPDFLISLVRIRERRLHRRVVTGLKASSRSSMFVAWNSHLKEATELASVHAVRVALECFNRALDRVEHPGARALMDRLLRLYALQEIAEFSTTLLVDEVVDRDVVARFELERTRLSAQLYEDATVVRDGFDIPNSLLDAPIGEDYIAAYDHHSAQARPHSSFIRVAKKVPVDGEEPEAPVEEQDEPGDRGVA